MSSMLAIGNLARCRLFEMYPTSMSALAIMRELRGITDETAFSITHRLDFEAIFALSSPRTGFLLEELSRFPHRCRIAF